MKQLLLGLIILCGVACQNNVSIDKNEVCQKQLKPIVKFGLTDSTLMDTTANEIYMFAYSDSWTYSQVAVFEKIGALIKIKTELSESQTELRTERKITDLEWQFVESAVGKTNFWCIHQDSIRSTTIDGSYFTIKSKRGNVKHALHFDEVSPISMWVKDTAISDRLKLQAAAQTIFRISGLNPPRYPIVTYVKKANVYYFEIFARRFRTHLEVSVNGKEMLLEKGVAHFEFNKSELGKMTLKCVQTDFDGQKVTFEHIIDADFIKLLPLK
jgi:hypothetical protein